jgi:hypothetical protein
VTTPFWPAEPTTFWWVLQARSSGWYGGCRWGEVARGADELRSKLVRSSNGSRHWAAGARSERATGRLLEALEPAGFAVVQLDDHLVVGPTGVWLVASRDFPYPLSLGHRGGLWTGWHPVSEVLDEARRCGDAVAGVLQTPVEPVVAVHTAAVPGRHLLNGGVHVVDATRALVPLLRNRPPSLDDAEVARLTSLAPGAYGATNGRRRPGSSG